MISLLFARPTRGLRATLLGAARRAIWVGLSCTSLTAVGNADGHLDPMVLRAFDAYVEKSRADWGVPGVAIAIVDHGHVVSVRGYGVRKIGEPARVDGDTVFAIASITKSFTAAALAMLVDERRVSLDDPVRKFIPALELGTPELTENLTIRDLLAQRTCIESRNLLTWNSPYDRHELLRRMRYLKPVCAVRSRFVYNNLMFLLAGTVIPAVTGQSWDDFVANRIFDPLGMAASTTSTKVAEKRANVATPYIRIAGQFQPLPLFDEDNEAPAGSIHSTAADMARWIQVQVSHGSYGGKTLWSGDVDQEMHSLQMVVPREPPYSLFWPDAQFIGYGLGWFIYDSHGHKVVEHDGQSDGMQAIVSMMPEFGRGIVVLTNASLYGLAQSLVNRFYDVTLGVRARDWSSDFRTSFRAISDSIDPAAVIKNVPRIPGTHPSLDLAQYAGTFANQLLGSATVVQDVDGALLVKFLGRSGKLEHWHYDTFRVDWNRDMYLSLDIPFVTFELGVKGSVNAAEFSNGDRFERTSEANAQGGTVVVDGH